MALRAIVNAEASEATHNIEHVIGLVDGEYRSQMQQAASLLAASELHQAQHVIEEMLVGVASLELSARPMPWGGKTSCGPKTTQHLAADDSG